jgi:hypothetical protein
MFRVVALPGRWVPGDITIWYHSRKGKVKGVCVALSNLLVAEDITIWYQSHGFNTEPRWAMLVEVEEKVLEKNCCRNGQKFKFRTKVHALSLDGLDKWSLEPRFQVEIVSGGTNFEP